MFPANPYGLPMPIASPCNKVCTIDPRSGLCRGCGRTLDEIARWGSLADSERQRIMSELPERRETSGLAPMREQRRAGT
jgi:predicted Fe-S protein YdhL (DUF1289 family)